MRKTRNFVLAFLCCLVLRSKLGYAYHQGDLVDVELEGVDLLTAESPRFGIASKASISREDLDRVSLSFQDGLWGLPVYSLQSYKKFLSRIDITFVYSQGQIHSIESEAKYEDAEYENIRLHYDWVKEPEVQLKAGASVVMLFVVLCSVLFFIWACDLSDQSIPPEEGGFKAS